MSRPVTISSIARALPDEPREPLRAAGAGQHAERDLGQADLAGVLRARCADVGGQRDLEPAADGVAVQRGDHELRRLFEPVQRLVGVQAEVVLEVGVGVLEHPDVAPAQKNFSPAPVSTMTWTAGSMRASRIAASSSRIIS